VEDRATYTPDGDWSGVDTFVYRVEDGLDRSVGYTVTITVTAVNDAPTARPDEFRTGGRTVLIVAPPGLLVNDLDKDQDPLVISVTSPPVHGLLTVDPDGGFRYRAEAGYAGPDGFAYSIADPQGETSTAQVSLVVEPALPALRTEVVEAALQLGPPPPPPEPDQPNSVARSLVFISAASRQTVTAMGSPLLMLLASVGVAITAGRVGLNPVLGRRRSYPGTVSIYDPTSGGGLVTRDEDGVEVFIHRSALRPRSAQLRRGDRVTVQVIRDGFVATRIRPLPGESRHPGKAG
jgi:cold shock CspA family protein